MNQKCCGAHLEVMGFVFGWWYLQVHTSALLGWRNITAFEALMILTTFRHSCFLGNSLKIMFFISLHLFICLLFFCLCDGATQHNTLCWDGKYKLNNCSDREKFTAILEQQMLPSRPHLFQGRPWIFPQRQSKTTSGDIAKAWLGEDEGPDPSTTENVWRI